MESTKAPERPVFHDSGLGSFGSESDSSPVTQPLSTEAGASWAASKQTAGMGLKAKRMLFGVSYLGESVLDRRYTQPMLPWIMAEVRRRQDKRAVVLEVLAQTLKAVPVAGEGDGEGPGPGPAEAGAAPPLFEHKLQSLSRFARTHQDPKCFAYLTRANVEAAFSCHVFEANEEGQVPELFTAIREATRVAVKDYQWHLSTNEGKSVDAVGELENATLTGRLFEVMYIGKAKVKDKKGPPTIIDEAVEMFQAQEKQEKDQEEKEKEKKRHLDLVLASGGRRRHESGTSVQSLPSNIETSVSVKENQLSQQNSCNEEENRQNQSNESRLSNSSSTTTSSSVSSSTTTGTGVGGGVSTSTTSSTKSSSADNLTNGNTTLLSSSAPTPADALSSDESLVDVVDPNRNRKDSEGRQFPAEEEEDGEEVAPPVRSGSNRVLLIQVGQYELCLISPDKKTVILERKFKDIAFCFQGIKHPEHFGFNTRDPTSGNFVCYVFRCACKPVVEEIMQALQQAFHSAFQQSVKNHVVCELCPMHQLHKLCQEIEGLPPSRVFEILQRRIDQLNEKDYNEIMTGFKVEGLATDQEKCEVLMIMLRQVCEAKQREHIHISDNTKTTIKYDFNLMDKSKLSKFDNFKTKAKKSLANSFENLINRNKTKREEARDSFRERSWTTTDSDASYTRSFDSAYTPGSTPEGSPCTSPTLTRQKMVSFPTPPINPQPAHHYLDPAHDARQQFSRKRSATVGALPDVTQLQVSPAHPVNHTPNMDMGGAHSPLGPAPSRVMDVGMHSPRRTMYDRVSGRGMEAGMGGGMVNGGVAEDSPSPTPSAEGPKTTPQRKMSWRLGILNRVVTPVRPHDGDRISESPEREAGAGGDDRSPIRRPRLTSQALRALWRKAILETLLLIRMEKENISLQARQDAAEIKRIKLDYQEIIPCLKDVTKVWEDMLSTPGRPFVKLDSEKIHNAVKAGVPRHQRGDIWRLLVEHSRIKGDGVGAALGANVGAARYEDLLKQLTTQQHAILIDLGRTFPGHPYFARQLGAGQLSLFNLLKAYSLIDKEVGYCQGLSFVAGVLLMHMREELAFETLRHLMFKLGFRRQYRPDMVALQIQMYQLSRLLHDRCRDLYDHLERHDIAPTLYAAPWFLTIFASQFPLGFVARVFDLIFLQGVEVVFKVALVLLGDHRELIKQCNSFETVVEFLKTTLPSMSIIQMERVINQVFQLDISKQLHAYEVEYHVLQEEMVSSPQRGEADVIARLEAANQSLKGQNMELLEQLQTSHSNNTSLEIQISNLQANENKLRSHIRTLEIERAALLQTVAKLRTVVPDGVMESENISIPTIYPDVTFTSSPIHNPGLGRLLGPPTSPSKLRTGSMNELDTEVAAFTSGSHHHQHHQHQHHQNHQEHRQNGPTSAPRSPTLWVPQPRMGRRPMSSNN